MKLDGNQLEETNQKSLSAHHNRFDFLSDILTKKGDDVNTIIKKLQDFQIAIPSWALGAGGTRFGRFGYQGKPSNLEQKIDDVGMLHALTQTTGAISLHIPWDVPDDYQAIKELAASHDIIFDAVNSNTFQDQKNTANSYKFGSLSNTNKGARQQVIAHNIDVIKIGEKLGSKCLTVWLADGANFPGQCNFQSALQHTQDSLKDIYKTLPNDWKLFIESNAQQKPNIIFILADDMGYSNMGWQGSPIQTPNLDNLVEKGIFLERNNDAISYWNYTHAGANDLIRNGEKVYSPSNLDSEDSGNTYSTHMWANEAVDMLGSGNFNLN